MCKCSKFYTLSKSVSPEKIHAYIFLCVQPRFSKWLWLDPNHQSSDYKSNALPLSHRFQLPKQPHIFAIYGLTLLLYIVASPDPNPRGEGQLPNPNECNEGRDSNPLP